MGPSLLLLSENNPEIQLEMALKPTSKTETKTQHIFIFPLSLLVTENLFGSFKIKNQQ